MIYLAKHLEILLLLGAISWFLGEISGWSFKPPKNPEMAEKHFVTQPKWANILCARSSEKNIDRWSAHFQLGGIVLILLWLMFGVMGKELDPGELFWLVLVTYFLIPGWLIQYWQKTKQATHHKKHGNKTVL